ncbi:MAG TPA: hypothetical protein VKV77_14290 [Methylovirgula sp.]|nr:hypothetical protein [Methylovirgula sp.]
MTTETRVHDLLASIKSAQQRPLGDPRLEGLIGLAKSTFTESMSVTSGLTFYDLEVGAKLLYPVLTPLRNAIPRVSGKGGIQANWRAITAINTSGLRFGVSASNRGGVLAVATQDYTATYKGIGVETNVDFEAQYAGQGFDDIRAIAAKTGLEALMLGEEAMILGGNATTALGTTPTPSLSASSAGGSLATGTLSVICVALTLDGMMNATIAGGIQGQITRQNADGTSDTFGGGAAKQSSNATIAVTGPTGSVSATVAAVNGALGYAWFWGAAGSEVLGAITTINSLVIGAAPAGTQTAASLGVNDNSTNALAFDGLITQAVKSGSGAYCYTMATGTAGTGTPLTADGSGGIVEIDRAKPGAILRADRALRPVFRRRWRRRRRRLRNRHAGDGHPHVYQHIHRPLLQHAPDSGMGRRRGRRRSWKRQRPSRRIRRGDDGWLSLRRRRQRRRRIL